jgi:tetratricopeptide (TPR) repeat protein
MSKPQVITFPFLLLLLDYWPLSRLRLPGDKAQDSINAVGGPTASLTRLLVEKIPLFLMSAASALITLRVQTTAMYEALPFATRLGNAAVAYVKYIAKAFWPAGLAPLYPHPGHINMAAAVAAAVLLLIVTGIVLSQRNLAYLPVGWFWFLGSFVPMIGLVQVGVQSMADRYAYIPFLGLFTMLIWGAADLIAAKRMPKALYLASASAMVVALAWACHIQIGYWGDNLNIWNHTLQVTQKNYIAEDSIATALLMRGKPDEAAIHLRNAISINPQDPFAELNLGVYEQQHGNLNSALHRLELIPALTADPRVRATALTNAGFIHYTLKEYDAAKRSFENALGQRAETAQALIGLGLLAQRSQDLAQATMLYARAADLQTTPVTLLLLAQALDVQGKGESARMVRAKAAQLTPDLDDAARVTEDLLKN